MWAFFWGLRGFTSRGDVTSGSVFSSGVPAAPVELDVEAIALAAFMITCGPRLGHQW